MVEIESVLIDKTYYEKTFMENENQHPVEVMGKLYFEEQKQSFSDLSDIRFAQGEIYYHCKDYEAAIYKWENVHNNLEPWARKNMADAYVESDILDTAENIYKSITTDSLILNTEINLRLFHLYVQQNKFNEANQMIKNAVVLDPDYRNVSKIAYSFFVEQQDWENALEIAVNESIRTKSTEWFDILLSIFENDQLHKKNPTYYLPVLQVIGEESKLHFEQIVDKLWNHYKNESIYFEWLQVINQLVKEESEVISPYYMQEYIDMIGGKYSLSVMKPVVPNLLTAWLKVAGPNDRVFAASAVLAWNHQFPEVFTEKIINAGRTILAEEHLEIDILTECHDLLQAIKRWEKDNKLGTETVIPSFNSSLDLLAFTRQRLASLVDKQQELKASLSESIEINDDIVGRLNGSVHQLEDMQEEKIRVLQKAYKSMKDKLTAKMKEEIPLFLKSTTEIMKEDTDYRTIHLDLNIEMNNRIRNYMNETILPLFKQLLQDWIAQSQAELNESQERMDEWSTGFNELLGVDSLDLLCDFSILEDWKRDAERLSDNVSIDKENILLRRTPSQVLLKSAGKLFGSLPKNNTVLANTYKNFVEKEDYVEAAESVINKFFRQFELIEKAIARDIQIFFKEPYQTLKDTVVLKNNELEKNRSDYTEIKENPEKFLDPITLFEIRLDQYEIIAKKIIKGEYK
ncbi:MAG TPA: hypothetical protein VKZ77_13530 [Bacillaceae bacterium]|nr:hypothetical protein [Bacillaceae bacterium]